MAKNRKVKSIYILAIFSVAVFSLLFLTEPVKADEYYKQGTLLSTNLLNGLEDVAIIESFDCTASVSASTTVYAKFSQDGTNWYNHDGYKGWWDSCADGTTNIDLTVLEWTTANFYYKLKFETEISTSTAIVSQVKVNYSDTYTPPTLTDYHKQGSLVSTNLLEGTKVNFFNGTEKFGYNITSLPAGTTVQAQFSQDAINWYSSTSTQWAWDTLSAGNHLDASSALDLSGLAWTENSFYYKLKFETTDSSETPILNEIKLLRRATVINAPITNYYTGGLVGYWTFNGQDMDWGSSTAEALDRSGNNNNGNVTNFGQEGAVIGQVGQALEFDGVNDYVEIYSSGELIAQNTISICAWIKRDQVTGPSQINIFVQNDTDSGNGYVTHQFAINGANGKLLYDNWLPNDGTLYSDDPLTAGVWQYVCVTRNNNEVIFYIDGGQSGGGTGETRQSAGEIDNVTIGARYYDNSPQWPFDGLIDEVRIYNRALSAEEIQNLYQAGARKFQVNTPITQKLTSGLVGHWTFNGQDMDWASSTAEALDRSGNSNNGNVVNGATPTIGISGQAFEFDGTDDYVDCGSDSSLNIIGDLTIMVWVKLPSPQVDTGYNHLDIFGAANPYSPYEGYILAVHRTTSKLAFFTADGGWDYSQGTILDDTWHQVAGVLNGSTVTFYIDGLASGSEASSAPTSYTGKKAIGANNEGNARINGIIDEVRVYNRALSAEEIQELYRAGSRGATIKN